ncbi:HpcH/HpaI aldolase/citrate lyase family protein [Salinigranum halophilum]|uniref:HpcH/HpaI aldolase/citrate lyase family protein n=1 Tax=Salinigranum halophilum TaxID=2565931 RepID=UPI00115DBEBC|nr:CoA ester lyase [Salinigranum halophilum]
MSRRSVLFAPGDRPELLRKAPRTEADTVVFDLEDAVAPSRRAEARTAVREVLSDPAFAPDCEVTVRLGELTADLDVLFEDGGDGDGAVSRLDALVVPKVESAADVRRVADAVAARGASLPLLALVETAEGVLNAPEIARVDHVDALVFGAEDFAASVGATRTLEGGEVSYARQRVLVAARAADVDAIDTLHTDYEDDEGLRADTATTVQLGYDGKLAIHPAQVAVINEALTPSEARIEWARRVLTAKERADAEGRGVFSVDGEMIDAPLVAQAERALERARAAGVEGSGE